MLCHRSFRIVGAEVGPSLTAATKAIGFEALCNLVVHACEVRPSGWGSMQESGPKMQVQTVEWWISRLCTSDSLKGRLAEILKQSLKGLWTTAAVPRRVQGLGMAWAADSQTGADSHRELSQDKVTIQAPRSDYLFERRLVK